MGSQDRLNAYLQEHRTREFSLRVHDCLIWANGAWAAQHGSGFADEAVQEYINNSARSPLMILKSWYGVLTLEGAVDQVLTRVEGVPPRGALVATDRSKSLVFDVALGIANGPTAIFLGEKGYEPLPIEEVCGAWI